MYEKLSTVEPNDLSEIITRLSDSSVETVPDTEGPAKLSKLALLQPLASTEVLAACRNPASRVMRNEHGAIVGPSNCEYLNIEPLSRAWRKTVKTAPFSIEVTFDLTLPTPASGSSSKEKSTPAKSDESAGPFKEARDSRNSSKEAEAANTTDEVYWDTDMPLKGGLAVVSRDVMTLTITLATQMRMRSKSEIRFVLVVPDEERARPSSRVVNHLRKQLAALEKHKATEKIEK